MHATLSRRFTSLAFAFLAAFAAFAAPASFSAAGAAEAPDFKPPAHWAGGWRELPGFTSGEMRLRSFLPAGSSEANWREALNLYTISPRPAGPPRQVAANIVTFMMHKAEAGCTALAQAVEDPLAEGPYVTQYAQFYCPRRPAEKVSRVEMLKVVAGTDALYVFTLMRQAPFFALQPPAPVSFAEPAETAAHNTWISQADDYLRKNVKVCDKGLLGGGPCSK